MNKIVYLSIVHVCTERLSSLWTFSFDVTFLASSPPKEHSKQSQSLLETTFTTFKEQALLLHVGDSEVPHLLDINNEKDEACTVTGD